MNNFYRIFNSELSEQKYQLGEKEKLFWFLESGNNCYKTTSEKIK